ncbi:glucosamine 6-phosphate acetyltransferase [Peziza echinospora]|nr:glucosamine 6-phosphate acetyltransferase [Peziza echinospora]
MSTPPPSSITPPPPLDPAALLAETLSTLSITSNDPLFSPTLLPSPEPPLPPNYLLRPLRPSDHVSFLSVLSVLTTVGEIPAEKWLERYAFMKSRPGEYFIIVIENLDTGKLVAIGTLLVEKKFLRGLGEVGHIEDIAVAREAQGLKFGQRIIQALDGIAESVGCYKAILDCSEKNEGFYVKCGYKKAGVQMANYYGQNKPKA